LAYWSKRYEESAAFASETARLNRERIHRSTRDAGLTASAVRSSFTLSRFEIANRAAFQSLLQKFLPRSNFSLVARAIGASAVPDAVAIGRVNGFLHFGQSITSCFDSGFGT